MRSADLRLTTVAALLALVVAGRAEAQPSAASGADAGGIQELAPVPGGYVYNQSGRRDPFMSLVRRGGPTEKGARKSGIEGLLIGELALRGILKNIDGYIAFLSGPDGKSYWVRTGQRFFDGQLVGIDATTTTFRQDVSDPLSPVKTRDVKKYLYPSEEATQ
jgi:Tfp pilus assembly protein PilP